MATQNVAYPIALPALLAAVIRQNSEARGILANSTTRQSHNHHLNMPIVVTLPDIVKVCWTGASCYTGYRLVTDRPVTISRTAR